MFRKFELNVLFYFLAQICFYTEEEPLQDWYWTKNEIQILYMIVGGIYKTHKSLIRNQLNRCTVQCVGQGRVSMMWIQITLDVI